eukprot:TRINITY_DN7191_c0_g1_i1.p1 TRINITY_DN7191_c0_g1~~TRINITY_DN7191_c0_g1_i1.p1  ORF type:complete len:235 (-),score=83.36 TRINITY_DN7191_c0_g1_i1:15-719(-)
MTSKNAIILEVLGGASNAHATQFYRHFGFMEEIAYEMKNGRKKRVRDDQCNQVVYWMGKVRSQNGLFISNEKLVEYLNINLIKNQKLKSTSRFSPPPKQLKSSPPPSKKTKRKSEKRKSKRKSKKKPSLVPQPELITPNEPPCVHCKPKCRFGGTDLGHMVCCDGCDKWFHLFCVGLSVSDAEKMNKFFCEECVSEEFLDRLKKLKELKEQGLIQSVQYENMKNQLKDEMTQNI